MTVESDRTKFNDVVKEFRFAMLTTMSKEGEFHARPMSVAEIKPDSTVYFATSLQSPKVEEISRDSNVVIIFQNSSQFATLTGQATTTQERTLIDRLWSETWRVWFPGGKDDPDLCLIAVEPERGELWDQSGLQGISYLLESIKAVASGAKPISDSDQHSKVTL